MAKKDAERKRKEKNKDSDAKKIWAKLYLTIINFNLIITKLSIN